MIHGHIAAVSSSSPSVAVPGLHVSCGTGVPGLHPWPSLRPVWMNSSATLLAPELGGRPESTLASGVGSALGVGGCQWGAGSWMGFGNRASHSCLSYCAGF